MNAEHWEKVIIVLGTAVITAFGAFLTRRAELNRIRQRPCRCPKCGDRHLATVQPPIRARRKKGG